MFLLLLFVVLLRREWLGLGVLWALMTLFGTLVGNPGISELPEAAVGAAVTLFLLYRYGLLALVSGMFVLHLWVFYPMTTELQAWYAFDFVIGAIICLALAGFGFYTSLAGQSVFSGKLLKD